MAGAIAHEFSDHDTGSPLTTGAMSSMAGFGLVAVGWSNPDTGDASISGGGVTWTKIGSVDWDTGGKRLQIFISDGIPADGTLEITVPNTATPEIFYSIDDLTGGNGTADTAVTASGTGTALALGDLGTLDAGDIAYFAMGSTNGAPAFSADTGSTLLTSEAGGSSFRSLCAGYSTTDETPSVTANSGDWGAVGVILNVAGGASSTVGALAGEGMVQHVHNPPARVTVFQRTIEKINGIWRPNGLYLPQGA